MSGESLLDYNELHVEDDSLIAAGKKDIAHHIETPMRVTVSLGCELPELSGQCPCFLTNKRVLTSEESDKRILHSTLQADLWVTKDTNKKGDMSSQ